MALAWGTANVSHVLYLIYLGMDKVCKKRGYKDKIKAMMALASCRKQTAYGDRHECRVYLCPICHQWHLTSKKLKNE